MQCGGPSTAAQIVLALAGGSSDLDSNWPRAV
jgi:hypothetical protein